MVWEPVENRTTFLITSHEQISCRLSEEKQNVHTFTQVSKQRKWKNIKKRGCRTVLEPCQISMTEHCCENTTAKSFIIDV